MFDISTHWVGPGCADGMAWLDLWSLVTGGGRGRFSVLWKKRGLAFVATSVGFF